MMRVRTFWVALLLAAGVGLPQAAFAQAVQVTLALDTNQVVAGSSTLLHVYAQIVPSLRTNTDRIFSFHLDVLNNNGAVATANYAAMLRPASDKDPSTSSTGFNDGAHRRGIYDTFINLPAAGRDTRVELMTIPVTGGALGTTRFQIAPGTGQPLLAADFIVAPSGGGEPLIGGDYTAASADLQVISGATCNVQLAIVWLAAEGGPENQVRLSFTPCPGRNHTVEYRDDPGLGTWQAYPGAPHNSGTLIVPNSPRPRFFRVRID